MIEYSTIASEALSTLQPFLELGGKEIIKSVAKDLWSKVKGEFTSKEEIEVLTKLESEPTDLKNQGKFEFLLESKLKENEELLDELNKLLNQIKKSEDYSSVISQKGNDNISISGKILGSNISINK